MFIPHVTPCQVAKACSNVSIFSILSRGDGCFPLALLSGNVFLKKNTKEEILYQVFRRWRCKMMNVFVHLFNANSIRKASQQNLLMGRNPVVKLTSLSQ